MSLINTEVKPFKATAFHNGEFVDITEADLKGKWSVVFFYPADFTFVCPTELGDLADNYAGNIGRDASELLRKVKAAQYVAKHPGEVCPAKWKEGEATLAPSLDLVGKI